MEWLKRTLILVGSAWHFAISPSALATPPVYASYHREQAIHIAIDAEELIRIWMIYVGQGDAILIQIPGALVGQDEPFDVLVDAGAFAPADAERCAAFLDMLYPGPATIEHIVVSHHDMDHVLGMTPVLERENLSFGSIWHNGLASYSPKAFNLSGADTAKIIRDGRGKSQRVMAVTEADGQSLQKKYLINSLAELTTALNQGKLISVYERLARSVSEKRPAVDSFERAWDGSSFVEVDSSEIHFEPLWPLKSPTKFKGWSETINGNSLSFRFAYKGFQMLFTGDHNELSEEAFLDHMTTSGRLSALEADVLKVPHHGSSRGYEAFFRSPDMAPVIGIASMGAKGFPGWGHPSTDVIKWLGGAHRFYSTYVHERAFSYDRFTASKREDLTEKSHILIETDGDWFRVVEIPIEAEIGEESIPPVENVQRGNGTRWISTKRES